MGAFLEDMPYAVLELFILRCVKKRDANEAAHDRSGGLVCVESPLMMRFPSLVHSRCSGLF